MVLIRRVDLETAQVDVLGSHDNGVRSVLYSSATGTPSRNTTFYSLSPCHE